MWHTRSRCPKLSGDDDAVKYYALIAVTERKTMLGVLSRVLAPREGFSRFPKPEEILREGEN